MQLRMARLCLDCEEVHSDYRCPACASDQFTYLIRWVPVPERRQAPRPPRPPSEDVETYRRLIDPEKAPRKARFFTRALVGLGAAGVLGLFMGSRIARDQGGADTDDDR